MLRCEVGVAALVDPRRLDDDLVYFGVGAASWSVSVRVLLNVALCDDYSMIRQLTTQQS